MNVAQVEELLLQSLEHQRGGIQLYEAALVNVQSPALRSEWRKYLAQTERHVIVLTEVCDSMGIDPLKQTPGTEIVKASGRSLLRSIAASRTLGNPAVAEIVAAECVVASETKDHLDWELLGEVARDLEEPHGKLLKAAFERIEEEEDEHLCHSQGWVRELWLDLLDLSSGARPAEAKDAPAVRTRHDWRH